VALGQVFSEYLGFPCQSSFHHLLHNHLSSGAVTIGSTKWTQSNVISSVEVSCFVNDMMSVCALLQ
jgi:hypothetical protein